MVHPELTDQQRPTAEEYKLLQKADFFLDHEAEVLKIPFCDTPEEAKNVVLSVAGLMPRDSISETRLLLATTGLKLRTARGDATRSTAVIATLGPDSVNDSAIVFRSDRYATLQVVSGFKNNGNSILWDGNAITDAVLEYLKQQKQAAIATSALQPLIDRRQQDSI